MFKSISRTNINRDGIGDPNTISNKIKVLLFTFVPVSLRSLERISMKRRRFTFPNNISSVAL